MAMSDEAKEYEERLDEYREPEGYDPTVEENEPDWLDRFVEFTDRCIVKIVKVLIAR